MGSSTTAEMIAKVKVSGMSEFKSDMTNMKVTIETTAKTAEQHAKLFKHLTTSLNDLGQSSQSSGSLLSSGIMAGLGPLGVALGVVTAAATAATAAFLSFTKAAVGEAISIQKLTATYAALSGGIDAAAQKMKFLETFSKTSINQFDDLAEAGTLLEASGLRVERFIKSIDQMSGLFGGGKQNVMELSEAIARMASGSMGEAERVFRRFGISTGDFVREGLRAGVGGQIQGTAEQMLTAFERIAKRKAGPLGDAIKDGMTLKLSNLQDAWNKLLAGFGKAWFPLIGKIVDSVGSFVSFLNDQDYFGKLGKQFADVVDKVSGVGNGQGIQKFLAYVAVGLQKLPGLLQTAGDFAKSAFKMLGESLTNVYNVIGQGWVNMLNGMKDVTRHGIDSFRGMLASVIDYVRNFGKNLQGVGGPIFGKLGDPLAKFGGDMDTDKLRMPINSRSGDYPKWMFKHDQFTPMKGVGDIAQKLGMDVFGKKFKNYENDVDKLFKQFQKSQKNPQTSVDGSQYPMFNQNYMAQIAQNTQRTAEATAHMADLRKFASGGGDLAAMGVTPAEMYAGRQHEINVHAGGKALNEALQHMIMDAMVQIERQNGRSMGTVIRG